MLGLTAAGSMMSLFGPDNINARDHIVLTGLCVAISGLILSFLFSRFKASNYAILYAADLMGPATGCVVIVLLMEDILCILYHIPRSVRFDGHGGLCLDDQQSSGRSIDCVADVACNRRTDRSASRC
jgi:hypothetical protein